MDCTILNPIIVLFVSNHHVLIFSACFHIEQHPMINDDLPNRILCGAVIIKPNVKQFTSDGHGVIFEDGTQVDHIDAVLMATGFNIAFPYVNENILSVKDNKVNRTNARQLLRCVFVGSIVQIHLAISFDSSNTCSNGHDSTMGFNQSNDRIASTMGSSCIQR